MTHIFKLCGCFPRYLWIAAFQIPLSHYHCYVHLGEWNTDGSFKKIPCTQMGFRSWIPWPCFGHWMWEDVVKCHFHSLACVFPGSGQYVEPLLFLLGRRQWKWCCILACLLVFMCISGQPESSTFQRCAEGKHHLSCQANSTLEEGNGSSPGELGAIGQKRIVWLSRPLLPPDLHMKDRGQRPGSDSGLLAESLDSGLRF